MSTGTACYKCGEIIRDKVKRIKVGNRYYHDKCVPSHFNQHEPITCKECIYGDGDKHPKTGELIENEQT